MFVYLDNVFTNLLSNHCNDSALKVQCNSWIHAHVGCGSDIVSFIGHILYSAFRLQKLPFV
jgi:hypothetical protein